jgi:allantoicase
MEDIEYQLEAVKATRVPAEDIDKVFRSGCIGLLTLFFA